MYNNCAATRLKVQKLDKNANFLCLKKRGQLQNHAISQPLDIF
jgi:hypothetical protein